MFDFIRKMSQEKRAQRERTAQEAQQHAREERVAAAGRALARLQTAPDVPQDIQDRVLGLVPVTDDNVDAVEALMALPAVRDLLARHQQVLAVADFVASLDREAVLSFALENFARHYGFSPMRAAGKYLDSPNTLGQIGYGAMVKGTTGAMITGSAIVGGAISSFRNGQIRAEVAGMTFSRRAASLTDLERQGLIALHALKASGDLPEREYKGILFAIIYADGQCQDSIAGDGLGGKISENALLARAIGHQLVGERVAPLSNAIHHIASATARMDVEVRAAIERQRAMPVE